MFYCDECATKHGWHQTFARSFGNCEMCRKTASCNDGPGGTVKATPKTADNESPDLSTLDREALVRMVGELQRKIAQIDKEYIHPEPSVPNPCTICGFHIYGSFTGDGDGSMRNSGRFAHPECYEKRRLETERDEARAGMAWLVDFLLSLEQVNATPDREGWIAKARKYGAEMRTRIRKLEQQVTLEDALADSNILTINILRLWDVEKTERFALHLLGDDWQGMVVENARSKVQVATLESVVRAKDREIGQLVESIDDRERIITKQGETLATTRAEASQAQAHSKSVDGLLLNAQRWLDVFKTYWMELTEATGVITTSRLTHGKHLAALRWIQRKRAKAELAEVETDNITGPWWVSFEQMLSQEQLDAIGLSEDRGATACITRLANAYTYSEQEADRQATAFHQSLRAYVDVKGEVERLRAALAQVGHATKRACYAAVDGARWDSYVERQALGRACALILAVDIATIVAVSAETADEPEPGTVAWHVARMGTWTFTPHPEGQCDQAILTKRDGVYVCGQCGRVMASRQEAAAEGRESDDAE